LTIWLFEANVGTGGATDRSERQGAGTIDKNALDPWGWFGHPELLSLYAEYHKLMMLLRCACIAGTHVESYPASAQTWDVSGTSKFIRGNQKNTYEVIDRSYA
jgi:hypothetical protein